jgi:hypothetical protein
VSSEQEVEKQGKAVINDEGKGAVRLRQVVQGDRRAAATHPSRCLRRGLQGVGLLWMAIKFAGLYGKEVPHRR